MLEFTFIHPKATADHVGFIPEFLSEEDPRSAVEQINQNYAHGGGWRDLPVGGSEGFSLAPTGLLLFPGDPALVPLAEASLHGGICEPDATGELIIVYTNAFVAVKRADGSYRVARID